MDSFSNSGALHQYLMEVVGWVVAPTQYYLIQGWMVFLILRCTEGVWSFHWYVTNYCLSPYQLLSLPEMRQKIIEEILTSYLKISPSNDKICEHVLLH